MKRKQLLAFMLAGTLTTGLVPAAVFAEETAAIETADTEALAEAEAPAEEAPAEAPQPEAPVETPQPEAPVETPQPEAPVETPQPEAPVETPQPEVPVETPQPEAPVETPQPEAPAPALPDDTQIEVFAAEEPEVTEAPEQGEGLIMVQGADGQYVNKATLEEAIAAVPDVTGENKPTQILVTGSVELEATVVIPANKNISIAAAGKDVVISRKAGFTGAMFKVTGGSSFQFGKGSEVLEGTDTQLDYNLTVDGTAKTGETVVAAEGAIVEVDAASSFGISEGITLTGNYSSVNGAAIRSEGGIIGLSGGQITGNSVAAAEGEAPGAVYTKGQVLVSGTVYLSGNTVVGDESIDVGVVLDGENAWIQVVKALSGSDVSYTKNNGKAGDAVLKIGTDEAGNPVMAMADAKVQLSYWDAAGLVVDDNGVLAETGEEKPDPTPTPTPTPAAMQLKGKDQKWDKTDRNSAKVVFSADKSGYYYVVWAKQGDPVPPVDKSKGSSMAANNLVTAYVRDLDPDSAIAVYVYAWDDKNVDAKPIAFYLDEATRPAKPTEVTPTPTTRPARTPKVSESVVKGLEKPLAFYPGKTYSFSVIGAGTDNKDPVKGDVQWRPLYWSSYSKPNTGQRQAIGTIGHKSGIKKAATFNLYIFFQKYVYDGNQWQPTDTVESAAYKFQSKEIDFTTTPGVSITPSITRPGDYNGGGPGGYGDPYGDNDGDDDDDYDDPESREDDDTDTGVTSTSANADTADNSPIAALMMMASVSLLAGGYVLVRKRKKATE